MAMGCELSLWAPRLVVPNRKGHGLSPSAVVNFCNPSSSETGGSKVQGCLESKAEGEERKKVQGGNERRGEEKEEERKERKGKGRLEAGRGRNSTVLPLSLAKP